MNQCCNGAQSCIAGSAQVLMACMCGASQHQTAARVL
jgi:hypothetical protein